MCFLLQIQNEGRFFLVDDVIVHMARASDSSATSPVIHIHTSDNKKRTEEDFALIVGKEALCIYSKAINSLLRSSYFISFIFGAARHFPLSPLPRWIEICLSVYRQSFWPSLVSAPRDPLSIYNA